MVGELGVAVYEEFNLALAPPAAALRQNLPFTVVCSTTELLVQPSLRIA
jgi:hypothetical protein